MYSHQTMAGVRRCNQTCLQRPPTGKW